MGNSSTQLVQTSRAFFMTGSLYGCKSRLDRMTVDICLPKFLRRFERNVFLELDLKMRGKTVNM